MLPGGVLGKVLITRTPVGSAEGWGRPSRGRRWAWLWLAYYISLAIICCLDISTSACRHRGWADSQDASQEQGGLHHFQVRLSQDIIIICKSVMCRVEKSEYFTRKGADVYTEASISLAQSALGGSVRVQGISEDINIQIPAGTSSHTR